jgi:tetratricopeptide (TPR) repeat protein/predicted Ser/Thr protein kinase
VSTRAVTAGVPTLGGELTMPSGGSGSGIYAQNTTLARGDMVGRYLVLSILGSGGMGSVYAAHDPELDRKVAVKIVQPTERMKASSADARQSLAREAQALARLSHPNVVAVHDVGDYEDGVFIAMEFVDGTTLRTWHHTAKPDWRTVLDVFVAAGRGLAAAHDEDIVHRDFKPENVMVDRNGGVRVLDFGLAHSEGEELETADRRRGTPAYMAPERHEWKRADARADQFSFCVALYEMLYERKPFAGATSDEIAIQILRGKLCAPPKASPVPATIGRAIMRGLSRDADQRFPTMHALLDELTGRASRGRRVAGILGVGISLGAMAAWGVTRQAGSECDAAREPVEDVWSDDARAAVSAAVLATDVPYGEGALARLTAALDEHTRQLGDRYVQLCEAARSDGAGADLAVRRACLERRRAELSATVDLLASTDAANVMFVNDAAAALSSVGDCDAANDDAAYREAVAHERAAELLDELAHAIALAHAGQARAAEDRLRPLLEEVSALDWPGTEARVGIALGEILSDQGDPAEALAVLRAAAEAAARAGSDRLLATALLSQLEHLAHRGTRAEVFALEPAVRAALIRSGEGRSSSQLENALGTALLFAGDYAAAEEAYRRAISGASPTAASAARFNLASVQFLRGDYVGAREAFRGEIEVTTEIYGENHPRTMQQRTNHADTLLVLGDAETALAIYDEALALVSTVESEASAERGRLEQHKAEALGHLGRVEEALELAEGALAKLESTYGAAHYHASAARSTIAELQRWRGRADEEERQARAAVEGLAAGLGADNSGTASARVQLARCLLRRGELEAASRELDLAMTALEAVNPEHPALVLVHMQRARLHAAQGDLAQATLAAERAHALAQGMSVSPLDRASASQLLALVIARADPSDARVAELAEAAEQLYQEIARHPDADLDGVRALRQNPAAAARSAFPPPERD